MDVPASQTQEEIVDVPVPHKESVYAAVSILEQIVAEIGSKSNARKLSRCFHVPDD